MVGFRIVVRVVFWVRVVRRDKERGWGEGVRGCLCRFEL